MRSFSSQEIGHEKLVDALAIHYCQTSRQSHPPLGKKVEERKTMLPKNSWTKHRTAWNILSRVLFFLNFSISVLGLLYASAVLPRCYLLSVSCWSLQPICSLLLPLIIHIFAFNYIFVLQLCRSHVIFLEKQLLLWPILFFFLKEK